MGYRFRTDRNAQKSGRKIASVRTAYLICSRRSLRADEFVSLEVINDSFHAESGFVEPDFVTGSDVGGDLVGRLALFQTFPNDHRSLVELIIFFGVEIDEYSFAAVEVGNDYMFARDQISHDFVLESVDGCGAAGRVPWPIFLQALE